MCTTCGTHSQTLEKQRHLHGNLFTIKLWPGRSLDNTTVRLQTYACESQEVVGSAAVQVGYESQTAELPLIVVEGDLAW